MEDRNFNPQDYHVEEDSDGPDYKDVLRFVVDRVAFWSR